jgi:hypothetical protein
VRLWRRRRRCFGDGCRARGRSDRAMVILSAVPKPREGVMGQLPAKGAVFGALKRVAGVDVYRKFLSTCDQ